MAINNSEETLNAVEEFVTKAKSVGAYTGTQATNLKFAFGLAHETARKKGLAVDTLSVGEFQGMIGDLLDEYVGQNPASAGTIRTYKARAHRLVRDFLNWHGGDFMSWKAALER